MKRQAIIAIAVAVVITAGTLLFLPTKNKDPDQTSQSSRQTNRSDPSENGKYLVIKEWGVRMPLPTNSTANELAYQAIVYDPSDNAVTAIDLPNQADVSDICFGFTVFREKTNHKTDPWPDRTEKGLLHDPIYLGSFAYTWQSRVTSCNLQGEQLRLAELRQDQINNSLEKMEVITSN